MIKLSKLRLKNFFSHVDTTIDLEKYSGLVLIEGITSDGHYSSNGAGKSTLLEGLIYALSGDTLRGVSVNEVINRNQKKNTKVALEFSKEDIPYQVSRYRKDEVHGDSLVLVRDEKDISKRVNKETQKSLEDILGISYKVLVSTIFLGEGLSSRFTQLSDPEKKSLIESTLNMNFDMNNIRNSSNDRLKTLRLEDATLSGEISTLESLLNVDVEKTEDYINDTIKCTNIYTATVESLQEEYDSLLPKIDSTNPKLQLITNTINKYNTLVDSYKSMIQLKSEYEDKINSILSSNSPVCSLCHQELSSAVSKESVINSYKEKRDEAVDNIALLESEIKGLPDIQILKSKYEELYSSYKRDSERSRELMQEINDFNIKLTESYKDIDTARNQLSSIRDSSDQLSERLKKKKTIEKEITIYEYFYSLFSPTGIIVNILSDAVEYINTRLSTYSEILLEKDYHISFIKGKISLADSKGSSYQSLSNGEKRRLDIAIQFSLHDYVHKYCGLQLDCCFIDEVLDTLDDIGVENIFDVLRLKLEYCQLKSIYVITHNNSLKSKFDNIITIEKDGAGNSFMH